MRERFLLAWRIKQNVLQYSGLNAQVAIRGNTTVMAFQTSKHYRKHHRIFCHAAAYVFSKNFAAGLLRTSGKNFWARCWGGDFHSETLTACTRGRIWRYGSKYLVFRIGSIRPRILTCKLDNEHLTQGMSSNPCRTWGEDFPTLSHANISMSTEHVTISLTKILHGRQGAIETLIRKHEAAIHKSKNTPGDYWNDAPVLF